MSPPTALTTQPPSTSSNDDAVTAYARAVVAGTEVAGPWVRAAGQRHLNDLVEGPERGLTWSPENAQWVLDFFPKALTVEIERRTDDGEEISEAVPFQLHSSQQFIVGSLFGWTNARGHRRFRRAYVEEAKGNGKSPLAAGIGHYMLVALKKLRAEIYSAATDKDQAAILFRDAVEMWKRSPALFANLTASGQNPVWQLTYLRYGSFFKPISSEKKGKSGIRPFCALIDEVHEHPDNSVIEMLRAGTKGNQQALIFEITNSGFDRNSVCWNEHDYSIRVATGEVQNDSWFSYVCAMDDNDEPFEDESCWPKANPLLGVSIYHPFIREQVAEAKGMPSKEAIVRRLHFCQWTDAEDGWITREVWEKCERPLKLEDFRGRVCFAGLDLSYTRDLSALALVFPTENTGAKSSAKKSTTQFDAFVWFWKPKEGLTVAIKEDRVPYDLWAKNGHLLLTEGKVIKLPPIAHKLAEIARDFKLKACAYDRYRHKELADDLEDLGITGLPMVEHPQGFRRGGVLKDEENPLKDKKDAEDNENPLWMPNSVQWTENAIVEERLRVQINPLMRWNVMSAVVRQDPAGTDNRIFDKRRSRARIDGLVALAEAIGAASVAAAKEKKYQLFFV